MGEVAVLHYYHDVPHVVVDEVYLQSHLRCLPNLIPRYRSHHQPFHPWEGHSMHLRLLCGGGSPTGSSDGPCDEFVDEPPEILPPDLPQVLETGPAISDGPGKSVLIPSSCVKTVPPTVSQLHGRVYKYSRPSSPCL